MLCISIYNYIIMYLALKQKNKTFNVKIIFLPSTKYKHQQKKMKWGNMI